MKIQIVIAMVISSQSVGSVAVCTTAGSETRLVSNASNNPIHERPAPVKDAPNYGIWDLTGEDIVRHPRRNAGRWSKQPLQQMTPTHLHTNPKVKADLVKTFFPKERYNLFGDGKGANGMIGMDMGGFVSPAGDVRFESNTFITDGGTTTAAVGDAVKRPAAITETAALAAAGGTSQFVAADAGDYLYAVQPVNRFGRGAAITPGGGALTVAAADEVTIGVTPSGTPLPEWYELYRSQVDGTALRRIARIPNAAGAGQQVLTDLNASLPFTTSAFMFQQNEESMTFKQLAPMVKIPLATIDSSIRWMQLLRIIKDFVQNLFVSLEVRPLSA